MSSPPGPKPLDATTILPVILSVILIAIVVMMIVLCICKSRSCKHERDSTDVGAHSPLHPTSKLIPPVFYTEDMRDPLLQEDLREHMPRGRRESEF